MSRVIVTRGLTKRYGETLALDAVDLAVGEGTVVGLLGPNGAGKTTLVEILEGLRRPTAGSVSVLGLDPGERGHGLRERIGVQLQHTSFPETLRVGEIVDLFRSFYARPLDRSEVLALAGLDGRVGARPDELSGGQRQRLALATALVGRPDLLILDEPTAGLDPGARRSLHDLIRDLRGEGRTILLTTHYTDEAEELCDRVLILRDGELVADGSPLELVRRARGESRIWIDVRGEMDPTPLLEAGSREDGAEGGYRCFRTDRPARAVVALGNLLREQGLELRDLRVKRPDLEDVYLELVEGAAGGPGGAGAADAAEAVPGRGGEPSAPGARRPE